MPKDYLCSDFSDIHLIRTKPGKDKSGKPFDAYIQKQMSAGKLRLECIRADVLGLKRPLEVYRQKREAPFIKTCDVPGDETCCPAHWADLVIGRGACGLRCRACFLMVTHRVKADPSRHILYDNLDDFEKVVRKWLKNPDRNSLGLGIDHSDSLLYEGVTGHARRLIPIFNDPKANPSGCALILLTKSTNVRYLKDLPTKNVIVTHSLNPEPIADIWEGHWPDGLRITPSINSRLADLKLAASWGFEVRWRLDPIIPVNGWEKIYGDFFKSAAKDRHRPSIITLGIYRETQRSLLTFAKNWGIQPMDWTPPEKMVKCGLYWHLPADECRKIYLTMKDLIDKAWKGRTYMPKIGVCRESKAIHQAVGTKPGQCNCEACKFTSTSPQA